MDLDSMLEELGPFGRYQVFCFVVLMFPVMLSGIRSTEYIFTTMHIPHRCYIPECEGLEGSQFDPPWLRFAVPTTEGAEGATPHECLRYRPLLPRGGEQPCAPGGFNRSATTTCDQWVFSEPTRTMSTDFNILCPEEYWKLSFITSTSMILSFIGIPLAGFFSDRVGRKTVLVGGCLMSSVLGIIRSLSGTYTLSLVLECVNGLLRGAIYGPAFVLGMEILAPSRRLLGSLLSHVFFSLGEVTLAMAMWWADDWRVMMRLLYIPTLALLAVHWLLPESIRWLYTQDRLEDVENIFKRMAKMNNTEDKLPKVLTQLHSSSKSKDENQNANKVIEKTSKLEKLKAALHSRIIIIRLMALSYCWVAAYFTFYGISQYTTVFDTSNRYVTFVLVSLVEVPANVATLWLPAWPLLGRQGSIICSFFICSLASFVLIFVRHEQAVLVTALFLAAKFASTVTLTVLYVHSAELFPTELRQTLLSFCSTVGVFGNILAQQTPVIITYFNPCILFSLMAILGAMFIMTCPETLKTSLPDTIKEAERVGGSNPPSTREKN